MRKNGFTLIEVLVALAVSALLLGILFQGLLQSQQQLSRQDERLAAVALAQNELERRASLAHREGQFGGSQGDLRWEAVEETIRSTPRGDRFLDRIAVTVFDARDRELASFELRKIRARGEQ